MAADETTLRAENRRLELAEDRYEGGVASYSDVLDAQRYQFSAQLNAVQTRNELLNATVQLYKALGSGLAPPDRDPNLRRNPMNIHIAGAGGGEVGSAYVQIDRACVLVDCGQFQGKRESEKFNRWKPPKRIKLDAVAITHAHLDHTGRLPLLAQKGHRVPVYATPATIEMTSLILRDSAHILAADAARKNRKLARAGEPPITPLYSPEDAEGALRMMRPVPYQEPVEIAPGIRATWTEAGHMLGSASIQLTVTEDGREKKIVFSGDLGPRRLSILRD